MAIEITDDNFKSEVESADGIVMIDFWAPWCSPCRIQDPIVEALAEEFKAEQRIKIGKMNVDENPNVAQNFQVMSIPTLKIFKEGKVVADMIGLQSKEALKKALTEHLS